MNIENTLQKITLLTRIINTRLRRYPRAYMNYSDKVNPSGLHNWRAELINKLEEYTDYVYVVKIDDDTETAVMYNREQWLKDNGVVKENGVWCI